LNKWTLKIGKSSIPLDELLNDTNSLVKNVTSLLELVKTFGNKSVLTHALRRGKEFVDIFVSSLFPKLHANFKSEPEKIITLLKQLQVGTRILQTLCSHSKVSQDNGLMGIVPALRKSLETLLFKVKMMLQQHGSLSAFWMGNLKHRNIVGEEVSSQISVRESVEEPIEEIAMIETDSDEVIAHNFNFWNRKVFKVIQPKYLLHACLISGSEVNNLR
jgi:Fanconi anemia group D2 protein